jgi:lipopolysaccharide export system permease protein
MILWELVKIFALSLVAITGILLMAGIIAEASQQGLGPAQILAIIPLLVPSTLPYTIPATTLFATCLVYGRLAADNEILAIKSAGANVLLVVWPGLLLGLVISLTTLSLYYHIIPFTHNLLRSWVLTNPQELMYANLKKDQKISHPKLDWEITVRRVQGRKLENVLIKRRGKNGGFDLFIKADEATLEVDLKTDPLKPKLLVHLRNGQIHHEGGFGGNFLDRTVEVDLEPRFLSNHTPRPRDMTWKELYENRDKVTLEIEDIDEQLAQAEAGQLPQGHRPEKVPEHLKNLRERRTFYLQEIHQINAEFHMRPALSLGCLCFVLIGCPVGIWFSRSDYLSAFITCFLPIVLIYYPLTLCCTNLAKEGFRYSELAVWAADLLLCLIALPLYQRLLKH